MVSTVRFSDIGRIEMNDGACSGEYELSAIDGGVANLRTGYIRCDVMDSYLQGVTATLEGDSLTITGPKINGILRASRMSQPTRLTRSAGW